MPKRTFGTLLALAFLATSSAFADRNKPKEAKSNDSKPAAKAPSNPAPRAEPAQRSAPAPKPAESKPAPTPKPAPAPTQRQPSISTPAPKPSNPPPSTPAPKIEKRSGDEPRSRVQEGFRKAAERRNGNDNRSLPTPSAGSNGSENPGSKPAAPLPKPGPLPSAPSAGKQGQAKPSLSSGRLESKQPTANAVPNIAAPKNEQPSNSAASNITPTPKRQTSEAPDRKQRLVSEWLEKHKTPTARPNPNTAGGAVSNLVPGGVVGGGSKGPGSSKGVGPSHDDHDRNKGSSAGNFAKPGVTVGRNSGAIDRDRHDDHDDHRQGSRNVWVRGVDQLHHRHYCYQDHSTRWSWLFVGSAFNSPSYTVVQPYPVTTVTPIYVDPNPNPNFQNPQQASGLPRPPRPEVPTSDEFNDLPIEYQRQLLVVALNSLESDLSEDDNGDDWIRHLQLPTLAALLTEGDGLPDETTRERLQGVAGVFDEVASNPDFRPVSGLWGFRTLNIGLREFASDPIVRTRKQLSFAAKELSKVLNEMKSGDRWVDYLRLPTLVSLDDQPDDPQQRLADLEKLMSKFDRVKTDPAYEMIAQEQAFDFADFALRAYAEELRAALEPPKPQEPPMPELKQPLPVAPQPKEDAPKLEAPKIDPLEKEGQKSE